MKGRVFIDTSGWYAFVDSADSQHRSARGAVKALLDDGRRMVTTNHVVSESYTLLRTSLGARPAREFLLRIRRSRQVDRIFVSESWEKSAEDLLEQYGDQPFSYVDATSFVAMRRLDIQNVLAFDQHFASAGFNLLTA